MIFTEAQMALFTQESGLRFPFLSSLYHFLVPKYAWLCPRLC